MTQPPDSPEWDAEAEKWRINTLVFSVARYAGLGSIPLQQFCQSKNWRPVYLDHAAVILMRQRPENEEWIRRLAVDCAKVAFTPPASIPTGQSSRSAAELYNFHMNTASIAYVLGRDREAAEALDRAERIFYDDSNLHLLKAQLFQANSRPAEAKAAYLASLQLRSTDAAWHALGRMYIAERNYTEAARCLEEAARISQQPYDRYVTLGQLYTALNRPDEALAAYARAEATSPYRGESEALGAEFRARIAEGRARAWRARGDAGAAIVFQEQAVTHTPQSAARWTLLAELYEVAGRSEKALDARQRAKAAMESAPAPNR
jgi:tetratricopeptide (TPR) repeat protein